MPPLPRSLSFLPMLPRIAALILFLACLGLGYLGGSRLRPAAPAPAPPSHDAADSRRLDDRIHSLESDLATLRAAPPAPAPTRVEPLQSESARVGPNRLDAVRLLRTSGATVSVRVFDATNTSIAPPAKTFFHLTDDESAKLSAAYARARKASEDGATASATITQSTESSLTIVIPAFDGGSSIYAQFAADLDAALGPDRGKELLEIGADEFKTTLNNAGTGERTVTVNRVVPIPLPNGNPGYQFRTMERISQGAMRMGAFITTADNPSVKWLSRFDDQLSALKPPPGQ